MEQLFGENSHPELVRRCAEIPNFLSLENCLTDQDVELIWAAGVDKHQAITHVIYSLIESLSKNLKMQHINLIFEKIKMIPFSSYDNRTIQLIRSLSKLEISEAHSSNFVAQLKALNGINIIWNLIQDNSGVSNDIRQYSYQFFQDYSWKECHNLAVELIELCIENIKTHQSSCPAFKVLCIIFHSFGYSNLSTLLSQIEETKHFLELCLNDLQEYKRRVLEKVKLSSENINFMCFNSKTPYIQEIRERLEFLEYILCSSKIDISEKIINIFWDCIIINGLSADEKDYGFKWLDATKERHADSSKNIILYIFREKFSGLNNWSTQAFSVAYNYFKVINTKNNCLAIQDDDVIVKSYKLEGIQLFWNIILNSKSMDVVRSAIYVLNKLQSNVDPSLSDQIVQERENYINTCMDYLNNAKQEENNAIIDRCLIILKSFVEEFESKLSNRHSTLKKGKLLKLNINNISQKERKELSIYSNTTIGSLKKAIADVFKDNVKQLRVSTNGKDLTMDSKSIDSSGIIDGQTINVNWRNTRNSLTMSNNSNNNVNVNVDENILPSRILSEEKYFSQLFELLEYNERIAQKVWDVLMLLPTNQKIYDTISTITITTNWNELLTTTSIYKLLYILQIIDSIIDFNGEDTEKKQTWCDLFETTGGLFRLIDILNNQISYTPNSGPHSRACINLLLQIIVLLISKNVNNIEKYITSRNSSKDIVLKLLNIIECSSNINISLEDLKIVEYSFKLLVFCSQDNQILMYLLEFESLDQWIYKVLIQSKDTKIRELTKNALFEIHSKLKNSQSKPYFFNILIKFIQIKEENNSTAGQYFELLNKITTDMMTERSIREKFHELLNELIGLLLSHPITEKNNETVEDSVIIGILNLTTTLISSDPSLKSSQGNVLIQEVYEKCLFDWSLTSRDDPPKCKRTSSKIAAYNLLLELAKDNSSNFLTISSKLLEQHNQFYHNTLDNLWQYSPNGSERANCGFVGLKNLGATCYMNSLMQQFFMTTEFRASLLALKLTEDTQDNNLLFQLQKLFGFLQCSQKKFYDTSEFCKAYRDQGQPFIPSQQMDADEFFNILFEKLESHLQKTEFRNFFKDFFGGKVCNQIISKECSHVSETTEDFYTISVAVKGKTSLLDSLDLFVEGDKLEGDNKYACSQCNSKVDALKRCCIDTLPNNLIIHMRRFEFDIEYMQRMKVDDFCQFPMILQMDQYTKEGLMNKEKKNSVTMKDPSYYQFELVGILVHSGTAEFGHYYSFIKDREKSSKTYSQWFQFNDHTVEPFEEKDIPNTCFGGVETIFQYDHTLRKKVSHTVQRSGSAYMLFYQRTTPEPFHFDIPPIRSAIPDKIFDEINNENLQFLKDKLIFNQTYFNFISKLLLEYSNAETVDCNSPLDENCPIFKSIKLGIIYFIKTYSRAKDRELTSFVTTMKKLLSIHHPGCFWLLSQSISENWAKQILLICNANDARDAYSSMIIRGMESITPYEKDRYFEVDEETMKNDDNNEINADYVPPIYPVCKSIQFIEHLLSLSSIAKTKLQNLGQYFKIFVEFAKFGVQEKKYLLSRSIITRFIELYVGDDSIVLTESSNSSTYRLGEKFNVLNIVPLVDLLSELVCSTKLSNHKTTSLYYKLTSDQEPLTLTQSDEKTITSIGSYKRLLFDNIHINDGALILHLVWEDLPMTEKIFKLVIQNLSVVDGKESFELLTKIMMMNDLQEERARMLLPLLLKAIDEISYVNVLQTIQFLTIISTQNPLISKELFNRIDEWIMKIFNPYDKVRDAVVGLIKLLCKQETESSNNQAEELVLNVLLKLLPRSENYITPSNFTVSQSECYTLNPWRLVEYFNLLKLFIKSNEDRIIFSRHLDKFFHVFSTIDVANINMDENKSALLKLLYHTLDEYEDLYEAILSKKEYINRIICYYINLQSNEANIQYNDDSISVLFEIILNCCKFNQNFKETFRQHRNLEWIIRYLYCSPSFVKISQVFYQILKLLAPNQNFRNTYIAYVLKLQNKQSYSVKNIVKLLELLLDQKEDMKTFCKYNGIEFLSSFPELREKTANLESLEIVSSLLQILINSTKCITKVDIPNTLRNWTSQIDLLLVIQAYITTFADNNTILTECFEFLVQASKISPNFYAHVLQYLLEKHKENFANSQNQLPPPFFPSTANEYYQFLFNILARPFQSSNNIKEVQTLGMFIFNTIFTCE